MVVAALILGVPLNLAAESLAEAAGKEKERKAKAAGSATKAKVVTEEDLRAIAAKRAEEGDYRSSSTMPAGDPSPSPGAVLEAERASREGRVQLAAIPEYQRRYLNPEYKGRPVSPAYKDQLAASAAKVQRAMEDLRLAQERFSLVSSYRNGSALLKAKDELARAFKELEELQDVVRRLSLR
jgi:hypothetical protein